MDKRVGNQNNIQILKKRASKVAKELKKLFPKAKIALNYRTPWQLLVAVVLSARCTDKKVNEITKALFKKYRTIDDYANANIKEFERYIKPTGFYHNKAKSIIAAAKFVKERYNGRLPKKIDEMVKIPGIGRKSANVILGSAYKIADGIAVDTHVARLSRLFGLTKNTDPEKIEKDLMAILPKREWIDFSYRMIKYGREYCPARSNKKCGILAKID